MVGLTLEPELSAVPAGGPAKVLIDAKVTVSSLAAAAPRPRLDCVLVLDVSSSMRSEGKIELSKKTLRFAIEDAQPCDRIAIVTYSDKAESVLPLTLMTPANRAIALSVVDTIEARGSTALCAGLVEGMRASQAACPAASPAAEVTSVLMCTDGHANRGPRGAKEIIEAMRSPWDHSPEGTTAMAVGRAGNGGAGSGASLYTFGFGSDHDAELLRELADAGGGVYYHVESADRIAESFADAIGGLSSTVAKGGRLEFEAGPGAVIERFWTSFEHAVAPDGQTGWVRLRDLQEGETKDVLLSLTLPAVAEPGLAAGDGTVADITSEPCLRARCAFVDITGPTAAPQCVEAAIAVARPPGLAGEPPLRNTEVRLQWARFRTAEVIRECDEKAAKGAIAEARAEASRARAEIQALASELEAATGAPPELLRSIDADYQVCLDGLASKERYRAHGRFKMKQKAHKHMWQRSAEAEDNFYTTPQSTQKKGRWLAMSGGAEEE